MRKTTALFFSVLLFLASAIPIASSTMPKAMSKENSVKNYERYITDREEAKRLLAAKQLAEYRASVEEQLYKSLTAKASLRWISEPFLEEQRFHESSGKQASRSKKGAVGVAQFMPSTWNTLKAWGSIPPWFDIHNESHQCIAQLVYLDYLYNIDWGLSRDKKALTLASYNAGPNRIRHAVKQYGKLWRNHIPGETRNYLIKLKPYV